MASKSLIEMTKAAEQAAELLKALANEDRLMILCHLADGEKNVGELQDILQLRQPTLSQQLSRLRSERLVKARRNGRTIYYSLSSDAAARVIDVLYELYCAPPKRTLTGARRPAPRTKAARSRARSAGARG